MNIRIETPSDYEVIENVIIEAFKNAVHTNKDERSLVRRLRDSLSYIPELSLVAEVHGRIVGHILFSRLIIRQASGRLVESLALAPVSVHPDFQRLGVGAALIKEGHRIATERGFTSVVVLGHPDYYPKFGYEIASRWGIKAPFDVPNEAFMAIELVDGSLASAAGVVQYPPEFGIE